MTAMQERILALGRSCLGARFRHQGRDPNVGLDCVGLLVWIARQIDMPAYDCRSYGRLPQGGLLEKHLSAAGLRAIAAGDVTVADIYLMRFDDAPQHVALCTDAGILHAYAQARKVVEHRLDSMWSDRIVGGYRFPIPLS